MIYILQGECSENIKIGYSAVNNIKRRLQDMWNISLETFTLLAIIEGEFKDESEIHRRFAHLRHHGEEIFSANDELLEFIESLTSVVPVKDFQPIDTPTRLPTSTITRVKELRNEGYSYSSIQSKMSEEGTKISRHTVDAYARGVRPEIDGKGSNNISMENRAIITKALIYLSKGFTPDQVSNIMELKPARVRRWKRLYWMDDSDQIRIF